MLLMGDRAAGRLLVVLRPEPDRAVLRLAGVLDQQGAKELLGLVPEVAPMGRVVLDMAGVERAERAALRELAALATQRSEASRLELRNVPVHVRHLRTLLDLEAVLANETL